MGWLESQIETRSRLDSELTERAYAELAASVSKPNERPPLVIDNLEQVDSAIKLCLQHCGVTPGKAPDDVTDFSERLEWFCRPSGTMRRPVRLDGTWYRNAFGALLGRLDTGEPIAILPRRTIGYQYLDPQTGRRVRVDAKAAAHIEPEATLFYRSLPPRPLEMADLVRFILGMFETADYLLMLVAAAVATLVGLLPARANQVAFGVVVPSGQVSLIAPIGALLTGVAISTVLINVCRNLVMQRVSIKMGVISEAATFARVLSLPASFFKQYASGNLSSRISKMSELTGMIASLLAGAGLTSVLSLVYLVQIGFYAPQLALPALGVVLAQAVFAVCATYASLRYTRLSMEEGANLSGTVTALLNGVQKIKLAGAEDRAFARWARGYARYARPTYNQPAIVRAMTAIVGIIGMVGTIVIYFNAGVAHLNVADYLSFNVAYGQMTAAVMGLAGLATQVAQIGPAIRMVKPILEARPEIDVEKPNVERITGGVEVTGVTFRYTDDSPYVLKDISFKIRPGEYVAIVGKSGCGKSTILRLLLGFETPERGTIFYGPVDASKVDLRSLRRNIGVVMQDGSLFMGDIYSNITIANPTATLDDAWEAAELAGIADDIRKMPMGMQTIVSEGGGGISGGQRQRLMIARAICGKRRILMFDEATSALDNVTQRHVSDSLDSLRCTRIVVAHRLSTVRHCDRILVVDDGHIAEEGTYEELIARNGLFAELVARQRLDKEG